MPWFRVDDNLALHPKTIRVGNAAVGMWVRSGSWCAQQLTDGFIPDQMVRVFGGPALAEKLVRAGFWLKVDGGYQFHEWGERQPSRARVEENRKAAATRKERWRERHENGVPETVPNGVTDSVPNAVGNANAAPPHARATRPGPARSSSSVGEESSSSVPRATTTAVIDPWAPGRPTDEPPF